MQRLLLIALWALIMTKSHALNQLFASKTKTIAVIGANGKTGKKAVTLALKKGNTVKVITTAGVFNTEGLNISNTKNLINVAGNVQDVDGLMTSLKGCDAAIFAASASKTGGTPQQVDRDGLVNVAKACIANNVPRLVVVSSGAVTKPFSPVYLFLNLFGGIMKAKVEGEQGVARLYAGLPEASKAKLGYTIIRPGGLTEEEPLGVSEIELNQGDDRSGRISRWDVAALCVESIDAPDAKNSIFEVYNRNTAKPLASVGLSNIFKKKAAEGEPRALTGKERNGKTFPEIFKGLLSNQ